MRQQHLCAKGQDGEIWSEESALSALSSPIGREARLPFASQTILEMGPQDRSLPPFCCPCSRFSYAPAPLLPAHTQPPLALNSLTGTYATSTYLAALKKSSKDLDALAKDIETFDKKIKDDEKVAALIRESSDGAGSAGADVCRVVCGIWRLELPGDWREGLLRALGEGRRSG
jgi:hypothetical protein